jgi:hypothetical protein
MKKLIFLLAISLILFSCKKEEPVTPETNYVYFKSSKKQTIFSISVMTSDSVFVKGVTRQEYLSAVDSTNDREYPWVYKMHLDDGSYHITTTCSIGILHFKKVEVDCIMNKDNKVIYFKY